MYTRTHARSYGMRGEGERSRVGISRRPWRPKWTNRRADVRGDTENTAASPTQATPWNEKSAYTLGPGFRLSGLRAFVVRPGYRDGNWSVGTESTGGGARSRHGNTSRYPVLESRWYTRWCTCSICISAHARSYKGSDFNRIAREYRAKTFCEKIVVPAGSCAFAVTTSQFECTKLKIIQNGVPIVHPFWSLNMRKQMIFFLLLLERFQ